LQVRVINQPHGPVAPGPLVMAFMVVIRAKPATLGNTYTDTLSLKAQGSRHQTEELQSHSSKVGYNT